MTFSQVQPQLTGFKVLSSTDMYSFYPSSGTWSSGVVTFVYKNHGLASSDSVTVSCANTSLGWNMGAKTATVVDADTFTVPLVADPGTFPNTNPYPMEAAGYDSARVTVKCAKYSKTFYSATYWQMDTLGGATNVQIQAKLNDDATWTNVGSTVTTLGLAAFAAPYDFMRFVVSGAGSPVVYVQK